MIPPEVTEAVKKYDTLPGFNIQTRIQAEFSFKRADVDEKCRR
jgi:hypothetical protein